MLFYSKSIKLGHLQHKKDDSKKSHMFWSWPTYFFPLIEPESTTYTPVPRAGHISYCIIYFCFKGKALFSTKLCTLCFMNWILFQIDFQDSKTFRVPSFQTPGEEGRQGEWEAVVRAPSSVALSQPSLDQKSHKQIVSKILAMSPGSAGCLTAFFLLGHV